MKTSWPRKTYLKKASRLMIGFLLFSQISAGLFLPADLSVWGIKPGQNADAAPVAWPAGYTYRRVITIDHTKVEGGSDLVDFPVLIKTTQDDFKTVANGGKLQSANGYDLIFTDSDCSTQLNHEIESYDGTTGSVVAWVRIPNLSASVDTTIYVYYDNAEVAASQENVAGTWNSNYVAVWHLNDKDGKVKDSTGHYDSTVKYSTEVDSRIGKGQNFTRSAYYNYIKFGDITELDNTQHYSVSYWVDSRLSANSVICGKKDTGTAISQWYWYSWNLFGDFVGDPYSGVGKYNKYPLNQNVDTWYHHTMIYDGTKPTDKEKLRLIQNGTEQVYSGTVNGPIPATTKNGGEFFLSSVTTSSLEGQIDEFRIMKNSVSVGWASTEYNNQNSPETFYSISLEGSLNATPVDAYSLDQRNASDVLMANAEVTANNIIKLSASVTDQDNPETLNLFFELKDNASGFDSPALPTVAGSCASGSNWNDCASKIWYANSGSGDYSASAFDGTVVVNGLSNDHYKWQVKACDDFGACSAWVAYDAVTPNFTSDSSTPEIGALTAGADSGNRNTLTSDDWFKESESGDDSQISFAWTDPASVSDDTFYYEINSEAGSTIDGTESSATDAFVDDLAISEGYSYFHARPRNGAGTWGAEKVFAIKYDIHGPNPMRVDSFSESSDFIYTFGDTVYTNDSVAVPGNFTAKIDTADNYALNQVLGSLAYGDTPSADLSSGPLYNLDYSVDNGTGLNGSINVDASDEAGNTTSTSFDVINDTTAPAGGGVSYTNGFYTSASVSVSANDGADSGAGINSGSRQMQRREALLSDGACVEYSSWEDVELSGAYPNYTDDTVVSGKCYQYQYLASDNVGNEAVYTSENSAKIDTTTPDAVAVTAGLDGDVRSGIVADTWLVLSGTGDDGKVSFAWTDPNSPSADAFYYEMNTNSEDTIAGVEDSTADAFVDNVALSEGTYYFHVKPRNGAGTWGVERTFKIKYDKTAPTGAGIASVVVASDTELDVSASAGADATSGLDASPYWFQETSGNAGGASSVAWQATTAFVNSGLTPNTKYTYQVKLKDTAGNESAYSDSVSKYTLASQVGDFTALDASDDSAYQINLSWTNKGQSGLKIEQDTDCDGSFDVVVYDATSTNPVSPYLVSGLTANTCYQFQVSSYNAEEALNGTAMPLSTQVTTPPAKPLGLAGVSSSADSIDWNWDDVVSATAYKIYQASDNALLNTVNPAVSAWHQTGLTPNKQYKVYVKASNANGDSPASASSSVYTLANKPSDLTNSDHASTQTTVSWSANGNPAGTEYYVENTTKGTNSDWITTTNWTSTGLACSQHYDIKVKARNTDGTETAYTGEISASTTACDNGGGGSGGGGGGGGGGSAEVYQAPLQPGASAENPSGDFKIMINNGASATTNRNVSLKLFAGSNVSTMAISNTSDFSGVSQEPYQATKNWTLTEGEGAKTVYAKFYTSYGQVSQTVSATISLDNTAPQVQTEQGSYNTDQDVLLNGQTEPGASVIVNWNNQYGMVLADSQGRWQANLSRLGEGTYGVKISAKDSAGNTSDESTINITVNQGTGENTEDGGLAGLLDQLLGNDEGTTGGETIVTVPAVTPLAMSSTTVGQLMPQVAGKFIADGDASSTDDLLASATNAIPDDVNALPLWKIIVLLIVIISLLILIYRYLRDRLK